MTSRRRRVIINNSDALHRTASNEGEALPVVSLLLDLPSSTKEIVINVGSNLDPIMPAYTMGPCAHNSSRTNCWMSNYGTSSVECYICCRF